ncbi:MAG: DUF1499 domain-containing protein [Cellvibrionaceae bacterium]
MKTWLLRLQIFLLVMLAGVAASHKYEVISFAALAQGFMVGLGGSLLLGALALVAMIWAGVNKKVGWTLPMVSVVVLAALPILLIVATAGDGFDKPRIHDITTDIHNPPAFSVAQSLRKEGENSLEYAIETLPALQSSAYPDIKPLMVSQTAFESYEQAKATLDTLGWEVIREDIVNYELEAVEETRLLGFKDDVIVRVQAAEGGSRIDVRSVSRVGVSDLGANAKRIQRYLAAFQAQ